MKRTPLKRYTRIKPKRRTPRRHKFIVRLTGIELFNLRFDCWLRDDFSCQSCGRIAYFRPRYDGDPKAYDMAHIRNKRMYGDTLENVKTLCHECHMREHTEGKR